MPFLPGHFLERSGHGLGDDGADSRFQTRLLGTFALMALALTIVGIYGVLGYSVAQRTQEIGVRMALGAQKADLLHMLMKKALVLISLGIVIGGAGALTLTRVLAKLDLRDSGKFLSYDGSEVPW